MTREPNTQYVLSLSYGKDSLACLEAIRILGLPLDRIVHAEVWATDTIHADLPPMVAFKAKADKIIKERYGIEVEHLCAERDGKKITYESVFYSVPNHRQSTLERIAANRERERERETSTGLLRDSRSPEALGARNSKSTIYGFPIRNGIWCNTLLKTRILDSIKRSFSLAPLSRGQL